MRRAHEKPACTVVRACAAPAMIAAIFIVLVASRVVHAQPSGENDDDDELPIETRTRVIANAPPIATVLAAAYRAASLDHDTGRSFARRARLGGLVPWVTVRAGSRTSWQDDDPDVGRGRALEARATWRLDRLVFDGRELQVAAMTAARRRERRRLATRVIKAYFTWRRATMAGSPVRAEESEAELDALTDGWFSETRRTASGDRTACSVLSSPRAVTP